MKFKDLLFPILLAFITVFALQYFFFSNKKVSEDDGKGIKSGQSFVAPKTKQESRPLNKEIDFIDEKRPGPIVKTEVDTHLAHFVFSTEGASIESLIFKDGLNGKMKALGTVFPVTSTEREDRCFILALREKTPYYYTFVGKRETESAIEVSYRYESPNSDFIIHKKFVVYKKTHKIDLDFTIETKKKLESGFEARLFFPSPLMPELGKDDIISAVVVNEKGVVQKTAKDKLNNQRYWVNPKLFGTDSKYFVHVMIDDTRKFSQRTYYKVSDNDMLFSILEGPVVEKNKSSWLLSFYFGPKEDKAMGVVDPRLEKTLEYSGILAPIAKFLLLLLKFLYKYLRNYGLAIIILTLLIKLLLLPFSIKAEKGMKQRVEFQKKLDYIQKKYKHDKVTLARERAELIKKHGMPGLGGCLPLFLQLPIFFALTRVLGSSIELYKAPFLWIPNLAAKDPYYILPILISGCMLIQAATTDPKQRMTILAMALVFGAISASFSAGLSLYIFSSVALGLVQTFVLKKLKKS